MEGGGGGDAARLRFSISLILSLSLLSRSGASFFFPLSKKKRTDGRMDGWRWKKIKFFFQIDALCFFLTGQR
jgi:hypothetical protein